MNLSGIAFIVKKGPHGSINVAPSEPIDFELDTRVLFKITFCLNTPMGTMLYFPKQNA